MKNKHEKLVCDTFATFIAKRKGLSINKRRYPDQEQRNVQAPDMLVECTDANMVLEHTEIESYPEQITDNVRIINLLTPLENMLRRRLPTPGKYQLTVAVGAVKGATHTEQIHKALVTWIMQKAPLLKLPTPYPPFDKHYVTETPAGVTFEVTLSRLRGPGANLSIMLAAPEDLETRTRQRIASAIDSKCPKLHNFRTDNKVSILLFESTHISCGNYLQTGEALTESIPSRTDAPDEVWLVETWPWIDPWCAWTLKHGPTLFPMVDDPGPHPLPASDYPPE